MSDSSNSGAKDQASTPDASSQASEFALCYDSASLFQGQRVVLITHAGEKYRLLLTRNNRLILQK